MRLKVETISALLINASYRKLRLCADRKSGAPVRQSPACCANRLLIVMMMKWCLMSSDVSWHIREVVTNAEAWFNNSLRPRKPEGSSGQPLRLSHSSWTTSYHKSADVDVYVRAGRKSRVVTETVLLCARMLHHFEDTIIYQPPQRNDCIFLRIYFYVIGQALKIRWNVVIYQADEKKKVL